MAKRSKLNARDLGLATVVAGLVDKPKPTWGEIAAVAGRGKGLTLEERILFDEIESCVAGGARLLDLFDTEIRRKLSERLGGASA